MTKEIKLTKGQTATICDCHAHLVEGHKWYAGVHDGKFYAERKATLAEKMTGAPNIIYMHIVINKTPRGQVTDHKNRDTLDNQCSNLRSATPGENNCNSIKQTNNKSGYKGVNWMKKDKRWRAQININGKGKHLGMFKEAEEAARAYDDAARELHGEFARTNF